MKKLVSATALVLTLAFSAGSVLAARQNTNTAPTGGGTMSSSKKSSKHHRRHHRRHHRKAAAKAANANT